MGTLFGDTFVHRTPADGDAGVTGTLFGDRVHSLRTWSISAALFCPWVTKWLLSYMIQIKNVFILLYERNPFGSSVIESKCLGSTNLVVSRL